MDKKFGTLELDSGLRLSLEFDNHERQSVQLNRYHAQRLAVALIEFSRKDVQHAPNKERDPHG